MYLLIALNISIIILGIHVLAESLFKNLLNIELDDIYRLYGNWSMPLLVCPTCMTSFWGTLLVLSYPDNYSFFEGFMILMQVGFINYVVSKII